MLFRAISVLYWRIYVDSPGSANYSAAPNSDAHPDEESPDAGRKNGIKLSCGVEQSGSSSGS